jgi:CarD family transcriptional regulator
MTSSPFPRAAQASPLRTHQHLVQALRSGWRLPRDGGTPSAALPSWSAQPAAFRRKDHALNYFPGQVLVHSHHGPATVSQILNRKIGKERKRYLKLEVHNADLSVEVPLEQAEELGVRPLLDVDGLREVFDLLLAPTGEKDGVWSRRVKKNADRLRSGDIRIIAGLIRDLTRWNEDKRLSFGEGKTLREALTPFVAEVALVLGIDEDAAAAAVDAAVLEGTRPTIPRSKLAVAS